MALALPSRPWEEGFGPSRAADPQEPVIHIPRVELMWPLAFQCIHDFSRLHLWTRVCSKTRILVLPAKEGPRVCVSPCEQAYRTIPTGARRPAREPEDCSDATERPWECLTCGYMGCCPAR